MRLARQQALRGCPPAKLPHRFRYFFKIRLHDSFEIVGPTLAPSLLRVGTKPSDSEQHVDGPDVVLCLERSFSSPDHSKLQFLLIRRDHRTAISARTRGESPACGFRRAGRFMNR